MAGFSKARNLHLSTDITFEGGILSDTRAELVIELLNYILYERQQIPLLPYQLKLCVDASKAKKTQEADRFNRPHVEKGADRKARLFLDDLQQICADLKKSFISCPEIDQVAILLGGTIVSPKESYVIQFPPTCPDADCLPFTSCKHKMFRQIIGDNILGALKTTLMPSNIMVLCSAPRSCPLIGFAPKHSVSPKMGTAVLFNIQCIYLVPICHDLSIYDCDTTDLSGLEALECSVCGIPEESHCNSDEHENEKESTVQSWNECEKLCREEFDNNEAASVGSKGSSERKAGRFCEHKKLNYIFSARKKGKVPVINSPQGLRSCSLACHVTSTPLVEKSNVDFFGSPLCSKDKFDIGETSSNNGEKTSTDRIWYQSSIVLKGFKDKL